jgi:hypothetical protein
MELSLRHPEVPFQILTHRIAIISEGLLCFFNEFWFQTVEINVYIMCAQYVFCTELGKAVSNVWTQPRDCSTHIGSEAKLIY